MERLVGVMLIRIVLLFHVLVLFLRGEQLLTVQVLQHIQQLLFRAVPFALPSLKQERAQMERLVEVMLILLAALVLVLVIFRGVGQLKVEGVLLHIQQLLFHVVQVVLPSLKQELATMEY